MGWNYLGILSLKSIFWKEDVNMYVGNAWKISKTKCSFNWFVF